METFVKAAAGVLIAVILALTLSKNSKDLALLLGLAVCTMVTLAAITYIQPIVQFMQQLQSIGNLDNTMVSILLKVVGIGLIAELSSLICADAGNSAMGKALQYLATAVILYLSLPMLSKLLELMETILGEI